MTTNTRQQGQQFFHDLAHSRDLKPTERQWAWLMALGILFVILGMIGLGMVVLMTLVSIFAFGILLIAGGAVQVIQAISYSGWKQKFSYLLIGLLYLFAGWVIISEPFLVSAAFTMVLAWILIFIGMSRIVIAVQNRKRQGWVWPLVGGLLSVILGFLILLQWPVTGLWVIGLFMSLEMIIHGWSYIALSLAEKRHQGPGLRA